MANDYLFSIAHTIEKIEHERELEILSLKNEIQKQKEEISTIKEILANHIDKPSTYKIANIWSPDEYIQSHDKRLWGESGLFRSQWTFQYAVRNLGCPFVVVKGYKRKRICKASDLEKWLFNPEVRDFLVKTEKMRNIGKVLTD